MSVIDILIMVLELVCRGRYLLNFTLSIKL